MKKQFWGSLLVLISWFLSSCASTGVSQKDLAQEYLTIGNAYYAMDKKEEAAEYYRKALELDNSLKKADYNLVRALLENGQVRESLEIIENLKKQDPGNLMLLETQGYAYFLLEQYNKSEEIYLEILEENPANTNAVYNLGLLAKEKEEYRKAMDYFLVVYDKDSDDSVIYQLGHLHYLEGENEEALEYFESYMEKKRNDRDALLIVLELYKENEDYSSALDTLDLLVRVENDDEARSEHYFTKAELLLTVVMDNKAGIEVFEKALTAGFSDETRISALMEEADVTVHDELEKIIEDVKKEEEEKSVDEEDDAGES